MKAEVPWNRPWINSIAVIAVRVVSHEVRFMFATITTIRNEKPTSAD